LSRDDFGLFDAPGAADRIRALVSFDHESSPSDLVAHVGLALVVRPESFEAEPGAWVDLLHAHPQRPAIAGEAELLLDQVALDPVGVIERPPPRESKMDYIFGDRCHGPRYPELLDVPGVTERVQVVADRAAGVCDDAASAGTLEALRESFVGLGVVFLLRGCNVERERLVRWERAFDDADRACKDERGFWDVYRRRVWILFQLLKRRYVD
jgi:hypothetical protein